MKKSIYVLLFVFFLSSYITCSSYAADEVQLPITSVCKKLQDVTELRKWQRMYMSTQEIADSPAMKKLVELGINKVHVLMVQPENVTTHEGKKVAGIMLLVGDGADGAHYLAVYRVLLEDDSIFICSKVMEPIKIESNELAHM